jgi:hypothetical protein
MRKQYMMYAAFLAASVCLSDVIATQPTYIQPRIDVDLSILCPETVRLNERFGIECNVLVKSCVPHYSEHPDLVKLMIPWNCRVDSGSVEWLGRLDQGLPVTLKLVVHAVQAGRGDSREIKAIDSTAPTRGNRPDNRDIAIDGAEAHPSLRVAENQAGTASRELFDTLAYLPGPIIHCIELPIDSLKAGRARVEYYSGTMNYLRITPTPLQSIAGDWFVAADSWRIRQREGSLMKMRDGWMAIYMLEPLDSFVAQMMIDSSAFPLTILRTEIPDTLGPYKKFRPFPRTAPVIQYVDFSLDSLRTGKAEIEYRLGTSNWVRFTLHDDEVSDSNPVIFPDKWDVGGHYREPPAESDKWLSLNLFAPFDTLTVHLEFKGERLSFLMRYPPPKK